MSSLLFWVYSALSEPSHSFPTKVTLPLPVVVPYSFVTTSLSLRKMRDRLMNSGWFQLVVPSYRPIVCTILFCLFELLQLMGRLRTTRQIDLGEWLLASFRPKRIRKTDPYVVWYKNYSSHEWCSYFCSTIIISFGLFSFLILVPGILLR